MKVHRLVLALFLSFAVAPVALAGVPEDCGEIWPRDGRSARLYMPFAVDQFPGARLETPSENLFTCEVSPYFAADANLGLEPFVYRELAATSATLSLMLPGEFSLTRSLPTARGAEVCHAEFYVYELVVARWPYPWPEQPQAPAIGPRVEWSFSENEFHLAAFGYARRNQTLLLENTGDADLVVHDIFQGVENSKLFIFPLEFEPGTIVPPGGQLAVDFDYYAINDRLLVVNPVLENPMLVVTNDSVRPVVCLTHRVYVHQSPEDFPKDQPPFRTVRLCDPSADRNGDGILDIADSVIPILSTLEDGADR